MTLRETYAETGEFDVKLLIDARESPGIDRVTVAMFNADGRPMDFTYKRWGTKLNLSFLIDDATPDGVSIIDINLSGRARGEWTERFSFWTIK